MSDIPRLITNLKLVRDDSHVMHHPAIEEVIAKLVEMEVDARRLDYLHDNTLETSYDIERECDEPHVIWRAQGGYNDREWHEVARGETLRAAIDAASGERK